jgi:hypothetical protein
MQLTLITGPAPTTIPLSPGSSPLPPALAAIYPMTRAQESLWIAYSVAPQHTLYNLTTKLSFNTNHHPVEKLVEG